MLAVVQHNSFHVPCFLVPCLSSRTPFSNVGKDPELLGDSPSDAPGTSHGSSPNEWPRKRDFFKPPEELTSCEARVDRSNYPGKVRKHQKPGSTCLEGAGS